MTLQDIFNLFRAALRPGRRTWATWWTTDILTVRFLATLTVLVLFSNWISHRWIFEYAGLHSQETFQRSIPALAAQSTHLVSITLEDYHQIFQGGCITANDLDNIIRHILEYEPAVLAIDLDTSASEFRNLQKQWLHNDKLVWARDATDVERGGKPDLELLPVLGGMDSEPSHWGLALFPRSPDWTVRTYQREFLVGTKYKPSFFWEITATFCRSKQGQDDKGCAHVTKLLQKQIGSDDNALDELELARPILHSRYSFPITRVGDVLSKGNVSYLNPLRDQIVLLGGFYSPGDRHPTPWGAESGVEIVGSAVEAELHPQGTQMGEVTKYTFKILLALLIAAMHNWLKPIYALLGTVGLLTGFVLFGNFLALFLTGYHADVVPLLLGIWIEQLYGSAQEANER